MKTLSTAMPLAYSRRAASPWESHYINQPSLDCIRERTMSGIFFLVGTMICFMCMITRQYGISGYATG